MTDEAVRSAIRNAVREVFRLGRECAKSPRDHAKYQTDAAEYAEQIILPVVSQRIEQALEEGFHQARAAGGVP